MDAPIKISLLTCRLFGTTRHESLPIVNHRIKLGWFFMTLGTLACGAGDL